MELAMPDPELMNGPNSAEYMQAWLDLYNLDNANFDGSTFEAMWNSEEPVSMKELETTLSSLSAIAVNGSAWRGLFVSPRIAERLPLHEGGVEAWHEGCHRVFNHVPGGHKKNILLPPVRI